MQPKQTGAGRAFRRLLDTDEATRRALEKTQLRMRLCAELMQRASAGTAAERDAIQEQCRRGFAEADRQDRQEWAALTDEPYPESAEDWQALASRAGLSPDKLLDGRYTMADLHMIVMGKLKPLAASTPSQPAAGDETSTIKPAWQAAFHSYNRAVKANPDLHDDRAIHAWLKEMDPDPDYKVPDEYETWARYLRAYRRAVAAPTTNQSRAGRTGRSIVRQSDL